MFPSQALPKYMNFSGSAEELIAVIDQVADALPMGVEPGEANERLIRHYVAVRVLDRPERMGKGVVYGYRHLLQYLVARRLLRNGFQLAKIAQYTGRVPTAALLKSLDGAPQRSEAQLLIEAYSARGAAEEHDAKDRDAVVARSMQVHASKGSAGNTAGPMAFLQKTRGYSFSADLVQPEADALGGAAASARSEPLLSMIDLADRFERTSREQRAQFEALSEHLERHLELRLMSLEKRLSMGAMKRDLQGGDDFRKQLMRVQDEMQRMHHALQTEVHGSLSQMAERQQQQTERLLQELMGRLERVLRHQEDTERSLAGLRNDLWALQRAFGSKPPNNKENKQDENKKKEEDGKR